MGGGRSGRYRTRNQGAVDQCLRLDMRILRRGGFVQPGARRSRRWRWHLKPGNQPAGTILFAIDLTAPDAGFAEPWFALNGEPRTQRIAIGSVPCRYGGTGSISFVLALAGAARCCRVSAACSPRANRTV